MTHLIARLFMLFRRPRPLCPYSCPYVGGPTGYGTGERPPPDVSRDITPDVPAAVRGVGVGSLFWPRVGSDG